MNTDKTQNSNASMHELRKLLFEKESARIDKLESILLNQGLHAQEVAKVLAEAVELRNRSDEELSIALAPTIEKSIQASIARDPQALSNALFPVMGPTIRKSIASTLAAMLQSLNQTLEHSFSKQGFLWRIEAVKTGKSFAEVVLLNTLIYRVEQVFLIHRETGVLLHHLSSDPTHTEDADVVSSMLTAVQDFIRDSFAGSTDQNIETLSMGDVQVLIEQGPDVVLAVVCRGNSPRTLHETMQVAIEDIQQNFVDELTAFDGDTEAFIATDEKLSPLLIADYKNKTEEKKSPLKAILFVALMFAIIFSWWAWHQIEISQTNTQWQSYLERLKAEPGIIVTGISDNDDVETITGLRDPLSQDPKALLAEYQLQNKNIHFEFEPYHALQPALILKRVSRLIQPPKSVELLLEDQTLLIRGVASEVWLTQAEQAALYVAGVESIDSTGLSILSSSFEQKQTHFPIKMDALPVKPKKNIIRKEEPKKKVVVTDAVILQRAISLLKPPTTVQMVYAKGILYVSGKASASWIDFAKHNFSKVEGIDSFYTSNLTNQGTKP